jgi:Spy/CpxP family protein refolding chaperone
MNKLRNLLVLILLIAGSMAIGQPQGGGGMTPEQRAKRITGMMKENLSLSAAQETKVEAINLKYAKKNDQTRNIADTTVRRKTLAEDNKKKDAELKLVLTPEQYKQYLKLVEEMKARRREGRN